MSKRLCLPLYLVALTKAGNGHRSTVHSVCLAPLLLALLSEYGHKTSACNKVVLLHVNPHTAWLHRFAFNNDSRKLRWVITANSALEALHTAACQGRGRVVAGPPALTLVWD